MGVRSGPKIPSRGPEFNLVLNGTFDSTAYWSATSTLGSSGTWGISSGVASIDGSQSAAKHLYASGYTSTLQDLYYRVTLEITAYTAGTLKISAHTGGATSGTSMTGLGTYSFDLQCTGNNSIYIMAESDFNGSIDNVSMVQIESDGSYVSPLVLCLDAMNAKSFAGEPAVNYMQWQNGYPQGWTANNDNNDTDGYKRMWLYNSGSDSRSYHCRRIRKVDGRRNVLHFLLRNKTANDLRWFFPLVGIPKSDKTSAFLLTYDYKVLSNNSTSTNPGWYVAGYNTLTQGGGFADLDLTDAGIGSLVDFDSNEQSLSQGVIPTTVGTGVADLGGGWYRRTITIAANTFVESGTDGSGSGGTGVYGRFGVYTSWGNLGDYSFLMHNIQLLKGNTIGAPVALGGLGPELITNGNMETTTGTGTSGITNWTFGGSPAAGSGRSTTSHEGTYSAALVVDSSATNCNIKQASVFPAGSTGKTFEITFWARVDSGSSSTSGPTVALYLDGATSAYSQYLTTTWKKCLFKFTKSSNSQSSFIVKRGGGTASRTIYIDQVSVKEITCARNATDGWKDISGNGNHGTFSSTDFGDSGDSDFRRHGEILLPASTNIASNPASINFDGSNDLVSTSFGVGLNPTTTLLSYALWVYPDTASGGQMFMAQSSWGASARAYFGQTGGYWGMGIQGSGWIGDGSQGAIAVVASAWYHIVIVFDGSNAKWYQNGNHIFDKAYTSYAFDMVLAFGNGSTWTPDYPWNGKIATCAIHKAALTHAQVKDMYNSQRSRFGL